jgi:hypothetical protein
MDLQVLPDESNNEYIFFDSTPQVVITPSFHGGMESGEGE